MITFINTTDINITEKTAVVIGKFDGEHRGHRKLFRTLKEEANKKRFKNRGLFIQNIAVKYRKK